MCQESDLKKKGMKSKNLYRFRAVEGATKSESFVFSALDDCWSGIG